MAEITNKDLNYKIGLDNNTWIAIADGDTIDINNISSDNNIIEIQCDIINANIGQVNPSFTWILTNQNTNEENKLTSTANTGKLTINRTGKIGVKVNVTYMATDGNQQTGNTVIDPSLNKPESFSVTFDIKKIDNNSNNNNPGEEIATIAPVQDKISISLNGVDWIEYDFEKYDLDNPYIIESKIGEFCYISRTNYTSTPTKYTWKSIGISVFYDPNQNGQIEIINTQYTSTKDNKALLKINETNANKKITITSSVTLKNNIFPSLQLFIYIKFDTVKSDGVLLKNINIDQNKFYIYPCTFNTDSLIYNKLGDFSKIKPNKSLMFGVCKSGDDDCDVDIILKNETNNIGSVTESKIITGYENDVFIYSENKYKCYFKIKDDIESFSNSDDYYTLLKYTYEVHLDYKEIVDRLKNKININKQNQQIVELNKFESFIYKICKTLNDDWLNISTSFIDFEKIKNYMVPFTISCMGLYYYKKNNKKVLPLNIYKTSDVYKLNSDSNFYDQKIVSLNNKSDLCGIAETPRYLPLRLFTSEEQIINGVYNINQVYKEDTNIENIIDINENTLYYNFNGFGTCVLDFVEDNIYDKDSLTLYIGNRIKWAIEIVKPSRYYIKHLENNNYLEKLEYLSYLQYLEKIYQLEIKNEKLLGPLGELPNTISKISNTVIDSTKKIENNFSYLKGSIEKCLNNQTKSLETNISSLNTKLTSSINDLTYSLENNLADQTDSINNNFEILSYNLHNDINLLTNDLVEQAKSDNESLITYLSILSTNLHNDIVEMYSAMSDKMEKQINSLHIDMELFNKAFNEKYKELTSTAEEKLRIIDNTLNRRVPNKKELMYEVTSELFKYSTFGTSSPNDVAKNAMHRSKMLWNELVKAQICDGAQVEIMPDIRCKTLELFIDNKEIDNKITINKNTQITSVITPKDATIKKIDWQSSDLDVFEVDNNGLIKCKSNGQAILTVSTTDGSLITKNITVTISNLNKNILNIL